MCDVLAAADVCLATLMNIPMFTTTYPNKVFDYMAAGRPTLLAIDGVIRSVMEDAGGGVFVPPGDPEALAGAVVALRHDGVTRARMGQAARRYVAEHFDRSRHAQMFTSLLHRLAGFHRTEFGHAHPAHHMVEPEAAKGAAT
jgi:glycosyltransferase involved in cell wall biosynthesis